VCNRIFRRILLSSFTCTSTRYLVRRWRTNNHSLGPYFYNLLQVTDTHQEIMSSTDRAIPVLHGSRSWM
jgi:hypothetical protein